MCISKDCHVVVESSHLFRAGDKFSTQFFVKDVAHFMVRKVMGELRDHHTIVLFGSTKEEPASRYVESLKRDGVDVLRMSALQSRFDSSRSFYRPLVYLHGLLDGFPEGSTVILVGFHHPRFEEALVKYKDRLQIHVSAFTTKTTHGGSLRLPDQWGDLVGSMTDLDSCVDLIKEEFRSSKKSVPSTKG